MSAMVLLAGLVACQPADEAALTVTPWVYESEGEPEALLDADGIGAGIDAAIAQVLRLDPALGFDAYEAVAAEADAACPAYDPEHTFQSYWVDDCTTAGGTRFYGWVLYQHEQNLPLETARCAEYGFYFGSATITTPGRVWDGWGQLAWSECQELGSGDDTWSGDWRGDFGLRGGDESWLTESLSLNLGMQAREGASGRTVTIDGGISGLPGDVPALSFTGLTVASDACVSGSVSVWDLAGVGYDVTLDCDACGALPAGDEVCIDPSPLLSWEGRPWG